ncbi:hypothetical protein QYF36_024664 [Acer negundo]|nr:hypothetical protein QYF36_024664 [Acer negundo]
MLPFSVSVKNGDKVCDLGIMEVDEFNVISIINDAKKAFEGNFIKEYDNLKLCIIFMWSMQQHLLETDATLLAVLEEYDKRNLDNIEFNIDVIPYASEPPNPNLIGQTPNSNIETQPNTTQSSSVVLVDFDIELDFEYIPDYESNDDSDVSLFDSIVEAEDSMDMDSKGSLHCDPNEMGGHHSSDEENGATRMVRYFVKHEWKPNLDMSISLGEKINDTISPYARRRLSEVVDDGRKLIVYHGRGEYHETVDSFGKRCLVNLSEMSCDCGQWQINGFPCAHAAAVIDYCRQYTHEYTHWYYSNEAFKLTYEGSINPIPDPSMCPDTEGAPPEPPKRRNVVGRPKKNRRREPDEGPAPLKSFTKHCKSCGSYGHNKRTCSTANQQPSRVSRNQSKKTKVPPPSSDDTKKYFACLVYLITKS